ncbi:MAG: hypothetical protein Q7V56_15975 [Gammaproteobacteria bacterium]|nr:hypothetical protein [Gammaproteobacteria bacterium]
MNRTYCAQLIAFIAMLVMTNASGQSLSVPDQLIERYAEMQITLITDEALEKPLAELLDEAVRYRDLHQTDPNAWVATARIRFGYASTQGIINGTRLMNFSRDELEHALTLDRLHNRGLTQAFLGYLYIGAPGWLLSFGDKDRGKELLEEAWAIDNTTDSNRYFYGFTNIVDENYSEAQQYYLQLLERVESNPNPRQPFLQALYVREVNKLLVSLEEELADD